MQVSVEEYTPGLWMKLKMINFKPVKLLRQLKSAEIKQLPKSTAIAGFF